jgi:hypothetical protein
MSLDPTSYELKAIAPFVGNDTTRPALSTMWTYVSEGGRTDMATDGYTIVVRRAGTHRDMTLEGVCKLSHAPVDHGSGPPGEWWRVFIPPTVSGKHPAERGINPTYVGLVADIERAAGKRQAEDFTPIAGTPKNRIAPQRAKLRGQACSTWVIGSDAMSGWLWSIKGATDSAPRWDGVIMPRRM